MNNQKERRIGDWLQLLANIGSLVVAVVALAISFKTEQRNAERYQAQMEQSSQIAKANIRPLLSVKTSGFTGVKLIVLENGGLGTAVIKKINFKKDDKNTHNLAELFEFGDKVIWDNFYTFAESDFFLRAGEQVTLLNLTREGLANQGLSQQQIDQIMMQFEAQEKQMVIEIDYEDVLENPQTSIVVSL